jgi:hypothetical protein
MVSEATMFLGVPFSLEAILLGTYMVLGETMFLGMIFFLGEFNLARGGESF